MTGAEVRDGLRIGVLVKQVPRPDVARFTGQGRLDRSGGLELNAYCRRAVAHGVRLAARTGGRCTAITLGPPTAADVLREARACGVDDSMHLCDPAFAGSDCAATARALARAIGRAGGFDLVLAGRSSIDAGTAVVPAMVAEYLGVPHIGPALDIRIGDDGAIHATLQHDDGDETVVVRGPALLTVAERSISPAKAAPETWPSPPADPPVTATDLGTGEWGQAGSPTVVRSLRQVRPVRDCTLFTGAEQAALAAALIARRLDGSRRAPAEPVPAGHGGGSPVVVLLDPFDPAGGAELLGHAATLAAPLGAGVLAIDAAGDDRELAGWGADAVLRPSGTEPRPLAASLAPRLAGARLILGPSTAWSRDVLARLAVRMGTGLIADVIELSLDDGVLSTRKPAGDVHLAEAVCRTDPPIVTVRTGNLPARTARHVAAPVPARHLPVEPDPAVVRLTRTQRDTVDALDRARAVLAVGRGVARADYPLLEPLRLLLGAELAASRPVTDAGDLPRGRQIGITGRSVAPDLYIAVGIAGSANHLSGITRAGTVVAANSDPAAPIFAAADVGLVGDWRTVVPALYASLAAHVRR